MEYADFLQWPAMIVTVIAFWGFIVSNVLWVVWGLHSNAQALIVLECVLLGMNARGFRKNLYGSRTSREH